MRRNTLRRWAFFLCALLLLVGFATRHPLSPWQPASGIAASSTRIVPPNHVVVVTVEEYSGKLLKAALHPFRFTFEPYFEEDILYLAGYGAKPSPSDELLGLRVLRTQFQSYKSWVVSGEKPPLAFDLDAPLTDYKAVWEGTTALGKIDIVQNENRLVKGDLVVTGLEPDGTVTLIYGEETVQLAPDMWHGFAAVQPPEGGEWTWLDTSDDDAFNAELGQYLAQDYTDTVLYVTNYGLWPLDRITPGFGFYADDLWPRP